MIYLYLYLGVGLAVLAIVFGAHQLSKNKESDSLRELLEAVNPERKKLAYRILNNIVAPVLGPLLIVWVWPAAIYMKIKDVAEKRERVKDEDFKVKREHLIQRFSFQEIEHKEIVKDPLNAVSSLPFGHLNSAWNNFVATHGESAELWSFSAEWKTSWGRRESRSGYSYVKDGKPGAFFLTVLKDLP